MTVIDNNTFNVAAWKLIASYLEDADLKNFGSTCTETRQIAKESFKTRNAELESLLSSYTCIKKFNVSTIIDVKRFCLGERHDIESHKESEKSIIEHLAKRGPVVVVLEAVPSLKRVVKEELKIINNDDHLLDLVVEHLSDSHNIHYTGWDDAESCEKLNNMKQAIQKPQTEKYEKIHLELKNKRDKIENLINQVNLICKELYELCSNTSDLQTPFEFKSPKLYNHYLKKLLTKETFFEGKDKIAELIKLMDARKRVEKEIDKAVLSHNEQEEECLELLDSFEEERERADVEMNTVMEKAYSTRVVSMAQTMASIDLYTQNLLLDREVTTVVIAGNCHFAVRKDRVDNQNYNLDAFYKEMDNHKAAVFLPTDTIHDFMI